MNVDPKAEKPKKGLSVFALVMITTGIITSIHGAPSMAEYGYSLISIYVLVALVFLLPSALISAELATGWPEDGGVYVWVKQAYDERMAFVAVWLQWIENVIWFPSILTVAVVAAVYGLDSSWKDEPLFIFLSINAVFWLLTMANLFGARAGSWVASIGTVFGRILPILFIFGLALVYLADGSRPAIDFAWGDLIPDLGNTQKLSFVVGAFLTFAGIEASASNAASARNPHRDYPIAIITSAGIALVLVTFIALAIALVVPAAQIDLAAGIMQAIEILLERTHFGWLLAVAGGLIALGMIGEVNNWIPAPTRGLLIAGKDGALPPYWQKENRYSAHQPILISQAFVFSAMSTMYLFFDVQVAFWLMNIVPTMLYILMYILMFTAAVRLRYRYPDVPRRYRVPFGNWGITALAALGSLAGLVAIAFAFLPPELVPPQQRPGYVTVIAIGFITFSLLPFGLYSLRRASWREEEAEDTDPPRPEKP